MGFLMSSGSRGSIFNSHAPCLAEHGKDQLAPNPHHTPSRAEPWPAGLIPWLKIVFAPRFLQVSAPKNSSIDPKSVY
jgi:hypothetical protein